MLEAAPNQPNEQTAQLQARLAVLERENAELRSALEAAALTRLAVCQSEPRLADAESLQPIEVNRDREQIVRDRVSGSSLEHRPLEAAVNAALQIIAEALYINLRITNI